MTQEELQRWQEASRERNIEIAQADARRIELDAEAQSQKLAEARREYDAEQGQEVLKGKVRLAVADLIKAAATLESSGVHLFTVARLAGASTHYVMVGEEHPMGNRVSDFFEWMAHFSVCKG